VYTPAKPLRSAMTCKGISFRISITNFASSKRFLMRKDKKKIHIMSLRKAENSQWPSPNLGMEFEEHDQNCKKNAM
jgi:hypothetical protein